MTRILPLLAQHLHMDMELPPLEIKSGYAPDVNARINKPNIAVILTHILDAVWDV